MKDFLLIPIFDQNIFGPQTSCHIPYGYTLIWRDKSFTDKIVGPIFGDPKIFNFFFF